MSDMYQDAKTAMEEAEEFDGYHNFGKLTVSPPRYMQWIDGVPIDVTPEQWRALKSKDRAMELTFTVDIQEFNSELTFQYERKVGFKSAEWRRIVKPSMEKVFGKDFDLGALSGLYVEIQDVPQIKNPEFNTIKFLKVFANRDEAFAAYNALISGESAPAPTPTPAPATTTPQAQTPPPPQPVANPNVEFPPNYGELSIWMTVVKSIKNELAQNKPINQIAETYDVGVEWVAKVQQGVYG